MIICLARQGPQYTIKHLWFCWHSFVDVHLYQESLFFFQISAPLLDEGQVQSIVDEIKKVLTDSLNRKREQAERTKSEDFDAEESAEDFDAEESDFNNEEFELEHKIEVHKRTITSSIFVLMLSILI